MTENTRNNWFDEDYYCNGLATGKSNYLDYRWLPDKTVPMAESIRDYLAMEPGSTVLDFGCSRGYLVKALRMIGMDAYGMDTSKWAITNCDVKVRGYVSNTFNSLAYDYVIGKDVAEHIPYVELQRIMKFLLSKTNKSLFLVVPLAWNDGGEYSCPRDEKDPSHAIRWTLASWIDFLRDQDNDFVTNGSFFIPGVKDAAIPWRRSCGFLTCKRI